MIINWRRGKAGFVGASKRLIKGFFDYAYAAVVAAPTVPGLEYTLPESRLHYSAPDSLLHYDMPESRIHYTMRSED